MNTRQNGRVNQRLIQVAVALTAALALAGCLRSETTIRVRPDGSGEVVERFLMNHEVVEMLAAMAQMGGNQDFSLVDEGELRARTLAMGDGVSFMGVEPLADSWGEGYEVRYQFSDINTLRVNQNPGDNVPMDDGEPSVQEFVTFAFQRGNPATLEVRLPQPEEVVSEADDPPSPDELAAAAQFYQDMRVQVRVEVIGTLVDTDAEYRSGNSVMLLDVDFNRILRDPELTRAVLANQTSSLAEIRKITGGAVGFDIEPKDRVVLRLR